MKENNNNKVTVIGIAGGTGSGKTTVVKRLVEVLPPHYVAVVPLDSYYNDTSHMTEEERPPSTGSSCTSSSPTCVPARPSNSLPTAT